MSSYDWLDEADQLGVLREVARQLQRIGDTLDELRPEPCGASNMFALPTSASGAVRSEDIRYCERSSGHPKDFHMSGGKRWET